MIPVSETSSSPPFFYFPLGPDAMTPRACREGMGFFFDFQGDPGRRGNRWVDTQNGLMVTNGAESSGGVCYFCCALLKLGLYIVCVSSLSLHIYVNVCDFKNSQDHQSIQQKQH